MSLGLVFNKQLLHILSFKLSLKLAITFVRLFLMPYGRGNNYMKTVHVNGIGVEKKVFLDMWPVTWESKRPIRSKMPAWIFPCHPLHRQTYHMALNAVTFPKNAIWVGLLR